MSVRISGRQLAPAAPGDFLGLSFEMRSLPAVAKEATGGNLVTLLRSLGRGVLRFGGTSADEQVAWARESPAAGSGGAGVAGNEAAGGAGGGASLPSWANTAIDPQDLAGLAALTRATGWRVLLTVNLGHYDPAAAAQEARAAQTALGWALAGIEIGNEPDRYARNGLRGGGWDFAAYRTQAAAYRRAIAAAAPGVAIAGPDPSSGVPGLAWLGAAARTLRPGLLTEHYYPLSSCGYRPTVGELLSTGVRGKDGAMLARMVGIARAAGTPLRVDEAGSVSCEGFRGVSDTFASALWALDYSAQALTAGAAGLNFHDLPARPSAYSPLVATSGAALRAGTLRAQPEWYGLLAARELPGSRPLGARVGGAAAGGPGGEELDASAFGAPDGRLRVVLVNYAPPGARPLAVRLTPAPAPRAGAPAGGSRWGPRRPPATPVWAAATRGAACCASRRPRRPRPGV